MDYGFVYSSTISRVLSEEFSYIFKGIRIIFFFQTALVASHYYTTVSNNIKLKKTIKIFLYFQELFKTQSKEVTAHSKGCDKSAKTS